MKRSAALTKMVHDDLVRHLARSDGQEDLCFALWQPSLGRDRETALVHDVILPNDGDRDVHGNVSFQPQFLERALGIALERESGLAFLHSHPAPGWQGMSPDDVRAEEGMVGAVLSTTGHPLLGMTLGASDEAWSARFWDRTAPREWKASWCETVRVIGERLEVSYCDALVPVPEVTPSQVRTVSAWGEERQAHLARLRVGIVGLGSVGMPVAEAMARTGVVQVRLIDFDTVEEENRDRLLHSTVRDVGRKKVDVAQEKLCESATATEFAAEAHAVSVCATDGYRLALDCDVLFSCVDRPWPRSVLNFIAYAHLIPVIDGGIKVSRTSSGKLRGADWKAHVVGHGHKCLLCHRQYDPSLVSAEREGYLNEPSYIESLPEDHPMKARQNVFAFSLGAAWLELRQFLMLTISPSGIGADFAENYHLVTGETDQDPSTCDEGCVFPQLEGLGEAAGHPGTEG